MDAFEKNGMLVIPLVGSLDAENSSRIGAEIRAAAAAHPDLSLCLDADRLTYISSSGLRVLLGLRKEFPGPLKVINVSPEVKEIFDLTGFSSLLEVSGKLRKVSVDGCEVLGSGAFGTVYRLNGDTIVKVFRCGEDALPIIRTEMECSRRAFLLGAPTAIPFDTVLVGDQYGAIYELVNAVSLNDRVIREPECLPDLIHRFAEFLRSVHSLNTAPGGLIPARDVYLGYLEDLSGVLPEEISARIRDLLMAMPDEFHFLHGDVHLKNVMDSDGTLMLIDMEKNCSGNPVFEFAGLYMSYVAFSLDDPGNCMAFFGFSAETALQIYRETLRNYLNPEEEIPAVEEQKILLLGNIRFLDVLVVEQAEIDTPLKRLRIENAVSRIRELLPAVSTLALRLS